MKHIGKKAELVKEKHSMPTWKIIDTPSSIASITKELLNPNNQGSAINKIAVAPDGMTIWAIVRRGDRNGNGRGGAQVMLYRSTDGGMSWSDAQYSKLVSTQSKIENGTFIWDLALSPDNPNIIAVACADIFVSPLLQEVWISTDKGDLWENSHWPPHGVKAGVDFISTMDISVDFKGRKILVGTRDGTGLGTNNLQVLGIPNYDPWNTQNTEGSPPSTNSVIGDILAAKFSQSFADDYNILLVYTDGTPEHAGTWLATGFHDISKNSTAWQEKKAHIEIRNSESKEGNSPYINEIVTARLEIPSDFHENTEGRRRIYVSTDAIDRIENVSPNRGVYRIDNSTVYTLMDNTATFGSITAQKMTRRVASIAYFGTCDVGKLLVGETLGDGNQASVQTWFTNSPTAHPLPYWFQSLKPTTGAAGQRQVSNARYNIGYGNAQVLWSPDGTVAFVATGSASLGPFAIPENEGGAVKPQAAWPAGYVNVIPCDESAFGISRSNGETWNQLSLINTLISKLTDISPSDDGKTIYLASVNTNIGAQGFDSVWRSSSNTDVIAPLQPLPIGTCWERVFTHVTALDCEDQQSDVALLRTVGWCADPTSEIVGWAAWNTLAAAWSPDFGEYWAMITLRNPVQDFTFESRTMLYFLSPDGLVQKMPFTGTAWSTALPNYDASINPAHTIAAMQDGKVIVGRGLGAPYATSISLNMDSDNPSFAVQLSSGKLTSGGAVHVAFDPAFDDNTIYYIAVAGPGGSVYRNSPTAQLRWADTKLASATQDTVGCVTEDILKNGFSGIVLAYIGQALYVSSEVAGVGVLRTIDDGTGQHGPLAGLPKPGIVWDHLKEGLPAGTSFTARPRALKSCGRCTPETDITLYAIDDRPYLPTSKIGVLWAYTDQTTKKNDKPLCIPII